MNEPLPPAYRSWTPGQESFPGLEQSFASPPPDPINPTVLPVQTTAAKGGLPFNINISNLSDLKAMVDRMGGVEGVLSTMGKVQKFMSTMQQFAPMIKLFMGKGKAAAADTSKGVSPRRRRTSRRRPAGRKRRTSKKR